MDQFGRGLFHVIILVALARLLKPDDFGLMAMLVLFVALGSLLIDSGFSQALIQRQNTTHTDESTIFFFTLGMAAFVALILCVSAPYIATFYGHPILREMTWWMALNLFLQAFGAIHTALLMKRLDFKTIAKSGVFATFVSGVVALSMAFNGWGVWSLVGQALASTVVMTVALWYLHSWRPRWVFSVESLRQYFKFGGFLLWTGLLHILYRNLYALLIGKLHSAEAVGYYNQARQVQDLPIKMLTGIAKKVAFPVFSGVSDDGFRLAGFLGKALQSVVFVTVPMMVGLILLAEPLVIVALGRKWLPMVPVVQALAIAGLFSPVNQVNLNALKAQGYVALNAKIQIIRLGVAVALLLVTSRWGIVAVAYGQAFASLFAAFLNAHFTGKLIDYGGLRQLRDVSPYAFACLPMALLVWLAAVQMPDPTAAGLGVLILLSAAIYFVTCRVMRLEALAHFMALIGRR